MSRKKDGGWGGRGSVHDCIAGLSSWKSTCTQGVPQVGYLLLFCTTSSQMKSGKL